MEEIMETKTAKAYSNGYNAGLYDEKQKYVEEMRHFSAELRNIAITVGIFSDGYNEIQAIAEKMYNSTID